MMQTKTFCIHHGTLPTSRITQILCNSKPVKLLEMSSPRFILQPIYTTMQGMSKPLNRKFPQKQYKITQDGRQNRVKLEAKQLPDEPAEGKAEVS